MHIEYRINGRVSAERFIELLEASGLGERRPVDDPGCIRGMLDNADLLVTAWREERLVGVARSLTDFHYACYLSDLAVHRDWQRSGIGRALIARTQSALGPRCKLILVAAPAPTKKFRPGDFRLPDATVFVFRQVSQAGASRSRRREENR